MYTVLFRIEQTSLFGEDKNIIFNLFILSSDLEIESSRTGDSNLYTLMNTLIYI